MCKASLRAGAASLALFAASAALAQEAPLPAPASEESSTQVGDIVVTATRSSEALSKVPVSVAAFDAAKLDDQGIRNFTDISRFTPGLNFQKNDRRSDNATIVSIRGISSEAGAATTGVYIDDTPIQIRNLGYGATNPFPQVFDLARVEVLRGPQGTLFGAGSEGGTIRFITPSPSLDAVSYYGRAEVAAINGGSPSYEAGAALGAPIVEGKVGARVSGYYRRDGGYVDRVDYFTKNTIDRNVNWKDAVVLRGAVTVKPTDDLQITPSLFFQRSYNNDNSFYTVSESNRREGVFRKNSYLTSLPRDRFYLPAIAAQWDVGNVSVISNTSWFERRATFLSDYYQFIRANFTSIPVAILPQYNNYPYPLQPGSVAPNVNEDGQSTFTQEVRIQSSDPSSRLRWVVGGFYLNGRQTSNQRTRDPYLNSDYLTYTGGVFNFDQWAQLIGLDPISNTGFIYRQVARSRDRQIAGFADASYELVEGLRLNVGARYGETRFSIVSRTDGVVVGPAAADTGERTERPFTPKVGLSYQANPDTLIYATAAKGFRPGGYNPRVGVVCNGNLASIGLADRPAIYDSDSVWSYELGTKNRLFDRSVSVDVSAYHIDWRNIQQRVLMPCGFQFFANAGSARSRGFDLSLQWRAQPGVDLGGQVGYNNAKFTRTVFSGPAATQSLVNAGDNIPLAPWTVNLFGQFEQDIAKDARGYLRLDYSFQSRQRGLTPARDPRSVSFAPQTREFAVDTHLVNMRVGARTGPFDVSLFANNLFDARPLVYRAAEVVGSPTVQERTFQPRTIGLTVAVRN